MRLAAALPPALATSGPCHAPTDEGLLPSGLRLRCPRCGAGIPGTACPSCGMSIDVRGGIVRALVPEARARLAAFIDEYERIREAEGRGSEDPGFYLGLPYTGDSGGDPRQWHVRARSYDYLVRHLLPNGDRRRGAAVLDLGAGNCWMSYRLALAGHRPCAVDLLANDADGMGAAHHFRARLPALFPRVQASFDRLPFADGQFDAAVFNASFHYAVEGSSVLREALRCLVPGGVAIVSDTPWYPRAADGHRMLAERQADFLRRHGTPGATLPMLGFLTDARLRSMALELSIRWEIHEPWYGLAWALRPALAELRGRRRPSRFRLYLARKPA